MRIVMIGQKGIPTLYGGVERHVEEVACRLAQKKGYRVFVYARPYYTPKTKKRYQRVNIINLPTLRTKHLDAISHVFLASLHAVFKVKPDIFHYHGIGPALCLWIPKLFAPQSKVVFTFHCQDYFHQKWGVIARWSLKIGEAVGCLLADEIIAVSLEIQRYIMRKYRRQSHYLPHGIKPSIPLPPQLIKKWSLKKGSYILAVSRLIPHKGLVYLIKAYQQVPTDKKLVIVGPSFYTNDYEKRLKQITKGDPRIIFLGAQQGKVLEELYSNAYIFVNASEQEGLPLSVMEAASFGRALLLSNIPPHKEMFGDLAFFFKNKNTKNLKDTLRALLTDAALVRQRAQLIKRFSQKKYNWEEIVERLILKYI